ncbi:MAG TPA: 6-phosphogluconolactonase [Thermoanaerobaculia bacterium]|nr:6-phosphogluconolactonase [Thermoanaerobaculia bacterium]
MSREHRFGDRRELARALAARVADGLDAALSARPAASLAVPGGSTPLPWFEELRARRLPWERVWLTLTDERWVAAEDPRSNEALVRRALLVGGAAAARFVGLKTDHDTPEAGVACCERRLAEIPRPFDAVVLGMGTDGHVASLFPGGDGGGFATSALPRCVAVRPPGELEPRVSLTLSALVDSRHLVLLITGDDKWSLYRRALAQNAPLLPVHRLLERAGSRLEVYWAP